MSDENILEIAGLNVDFPTRDGVVHAVRDISLSVRPGEVLGVVGESGSGKSLTARAIMNLLPAAADPSGHVQVRRKGGQMLDVLKERRESRAMRSIRGGQVGMIFQEPMTALSPMHSIGTQITTTLALHTDLTKAARRDRAKELLDLVQLPKPDEMLDKYPHQLSGGMRQRVMIAMALSCNPALLLADEPTTALDVTTEAQILHLIRSLQEQFNMAVIFITHNLGVVAEIADRVSVMYMGSIVETASVEDVFYNPKHPYSASLLRSIPRLDGQKRRRLETISGMIPDPLNLPQGCIFNPRCPQKIAGLCDATWPPEVTFDNNQVAACHLYEKEGAA